MQNGNEEQVVTHFFWQPGLRFPNCALPVVVHTISAAISIGCATVGQTWGKEE